MSSLLSLPATARRGVQRDPLFVAPQFAFAAPSAAEILPREGTFSGVYHRDR